MRGTLAPETRTPSLDLEWERVELLARCLAASRRGEELSAPLLDDLSVAQTGLTRLRRSGGPWGPMIEGLSPLEIDVLACTLAPEARSSVGWTFQTIQVGAAQPYPTPSLICDLLALEPHRCTDVYTALSPQAPLIRHRLVELDGDGPFAPVRPGAGIAAALLGTPSMRPAPPGSVALRTDVTWDDLVLPDTKVLALGEFLAWVRTRSTVFGEWGCRPPGGPVALFAGPSGTGKTLAAAVLANELGWPLYRVDVARLVSKYIGETEKNLNRLLDAAHGRELVLQIDEADSLFGKRGEVREARDRYANLEVSHLLARIENHDGPCILTTNLRGHLDPAFLRRFQVVVDFPRPGPAERARLWDLHLPRPAHRAPGVDPHLLGGQLNLAGGGIRNAALHAAVLAAAEGAAISLRHVAIAAWRELSKESQDFAVTELGPLGAHLPAAVVDEEAAR